MKAKGYFKLIEHFRKTKVLVIGDLMVDRFIRGKVSRISPEAPVPVVQVKEIESSAGGAGNVAMNLIAMGAKASCLGVVGRDEAGESLMEQFRKAGVDVEGLRTDPHRPTTIKTRVLAEHQQVVRFDQEKELPLSASLQRELENLVKEKIAKSDGVILSDYGKGVVTQKIIQTAIQTSKRYNKPVCVDPKVEHFRLYKQVTCITPNLLEAMGGMNKIKLNGKEEFENMGKAILRELQCRSVLITQGESGMTLFEKKRVTHIPTRAREVFDVTGAGDTVIAVLTLALASGADLVSAATLANFAAGIVVGKLGTATVSPTELKDALGFS